jgi:hypothetical protein
VNSWGVSQYSQNATCSAWPRRFRFSRIIINRQY